MAKGFWRHPKFGNRKQIGDLDKRMRLLKEKSECTTFSFNGCRGQEGVSSIVVNLVDYLSEVDGETKVLLIDANFGHPVLHEALDKSLGNGLAEILKGACSWSDAVSSTSSDSIHFLSAGAACGQLDGNVESGKLRGVLREMSGMYDYGIVDSDALLTSADGLTVAVACDATFLVIQAMNTPKEVGERAKSLLEDNECEVAGVLLNRLRQVIPGWMYRLL